MKANGVADKVENKSESRIYHTFTFLQSFNCYNFVTIDLCKQDGWVHKKSMQNKVFRPGIHLRAQDPWAAVGEIIPETYPTRWDFLKTVGIGIGITLLQYGIFAILLIKPWK